MKRKAFSMFLMIALVFSGAAMADQWIHVKVDDANGDEQVTINLPVSC